MIPDGFVRAEFDLNRAVYFNAPWPIRSIHPIEPDLELLRPDSSHEPGKHIERPKHPREFRLRRGDMNVPDAEQIVMVMRTDRPRDLGM